MEICKIRDLWQAISQFEADFERQYGIGLNEGMTLCSLSSSDRLSSGELAALMGLTCSNMSKVLCAAERKGLVERVLGEQDRRQMFFTLTPQGRELLSHIKCEEMTLPETLQKAIR